MYTAAAGDLHNHWCFFVPVGSDWIGRMGKKKKKRKKHLCLRANAISLLASDKVSTLNSNTVTGKKQNMSEVMLLSWTMVCSFFFFFLLVCFLAFTDLFFLSVKVVTEWQHNRPWRWKNKALKKKRQTEWKQPLANPKITFKINVVCVTWI